MFVRISLLSVMFFCLIPLSGMAEQVVDHPELFKSADVWSVRKAKGADVQWDVAYDAGILKVERKVAKISYVGATADFKVPEMVKLIFKARSSLDGTILFRFVDSTDQVHQYKFRKVEAGEWGTYVVDPDSRSKQCWGGAKDKKVHYPISKIFFGIEQCKNSSGVAAFKDVQVVSNADSVAVVENQSAAVLKVISSAREWEIKGAKNIDVSWNVVENVGALRFKLNAGKAGYIGVFTALNQAEFETLFFESRSTVKANLLVRLIDSTGQVHQFKRSISASEVWNSFEIVPNEKGMQSWEGANDKVIHYPVQFVFLGLERYQGNEGLAGFRNLEFKGGVEVASSGSEQGGQYATVFGSANEWAPKGTKNVDVDWKSVDNSGVLNYKTSAAKMGYAGAYSAFNRDAFSTFAFKVKTSVKGRVLVRFIDSTDQVHQYKRNVSPVSDWKSFKIPVDDKGRQSWGGANDKRINFPVKQIFFGFDNTKATEGTIEFKDLELVTD